MEIPPLYIKEYYIINYRAAAIRYRLKYMAAA